MSDNASRSAKPAADITELGRYRIQDVLGRGAMGVVYKAYDPIIDRQLAIKTIRLDVSVDQDEKLAFYERFFREAQTAGKLSHPNIVTIHDIGEDKGVTFIAMELIEGVSLQHYVDHPGSLTLLQSLEVLREVALGLHYAHAKGIVHRDVKPANIMILTDDRVKVTDFGIAKISTASALTQSGVFLGSPNYMSPEQVMGKPLDGRSDIFSLGVMLYELVTGKKPFQGDHVAATIYNVANLKPPSVRELSPDVPASVSRLAKKAMQKNPDARYASARELSEEITAILEEMGVRRIVPVQTEGAIGPASGKARAEDQGARRMSRSALRRRAFDVAAGAFGASLLFLAITLLSTWLRPEPAVSSTAEPLTATIDDAGLRRREQEVLSQAEARPPSKEPPPDRRRPDHAAPAPPPRPTPSPAAAGAPPLRGTPVPAAASPAPAPAEPEAPPEEPRLEPAPGPSAEPAASPSPEPAVPTPARPEPTIDPRSQEVRQAALLNDYIERLQNAATYKARLDAADNLASLGDQRAVPYLQYSAQSDDSAFVRSRCRKILKDTFGVEAN